ncbi:MAG: patatin-like phospholipase family protein [Spirochaetota bacterium]
MKIGIAFGGGGAKGLAHVGVLRALRRRKIYAPAIAAGTSVGSIAAALYAGGISQTTIEALTKSVDWFPNVISFQDTVKHYIETKFEGLVSNANLGNMINRYMDGKTFNELEIDLAIISTDIENYRRVIFTSKRVSRSIDFEELYSFLPPPADCKPGFSTVVVDDFDNIGEAVRASCAVPGVFMPVEINGMQLFDGGLVDQVPVDVARAMGADLTIGISLSLSSLPRKSTRIMRAVSRSIEFLGVHQIRKSLELADIGFQIPDIDKRSFINLKQYDLIGKGEETMEYWLNRLEEKISEKLRQEDHHY